MWSTIRWMTKRMKNKVLRKETSMGLIGLILILGQYPEMATSIFDQPPRVRSLVFQKFFLFIVTKLLSYQWEDCWHLITTNISQPYMTYWVYNCNVKKCCATHLKYIRDLPMGRGPLVGKHYCSRFCLLRMVLTLCYFSSARVATLTTWNKYASIWF